VHAAVNRRDSNWRTGGCYAREVSNGQMRVHILEAVDLPQELPAVIVATYLPHISVHLIIPLNLHEDLKALDRRHCCPRPAPQW
jgi:hypothetical protein